MPPPETWIWIAALSPWVLLGLAIIIAEARRDKRGKG